MFNNQKPIIFSGSSNPELTRKINEYLNLLPGEIEKRRFADGEIWVKFRENIRGRDIYLVQSTNPPADNLMELLIMIDAARRASAKRITAVIPYFGYARQDRKDQPRVAITSKLIANLITTAGADRVITMDLHAAQIQGFFDIPFDHIYGSPIFTSLFKDKSENLVVVSPDVGGIKLARSYAQKIGGVPIVVIDKRRPKPNQVEAMNLIGDVRGKNVLLVDDLIDTGGTFVSAINTLKENGANLIWGAVTHPLLSGEAIKRIEESPIEALYVADTIPLKNNESDKIMQKSASAILAEAIIRTYRNESISSLFEIDKG